MGTSGENGYKNKPVDDNLLYFPVPDVTKAGECINY